MLKKSLFKLSFVLILMNSVTACGQNEAPLNVNENVEISSNVETDENKKISDNKWNVFREGFKKRTTIEDTVKKAQVEVQMNSINKEFNIKKPKKVTISERINLKKWEEFQTAFKERAIYYMENISKMIDG